MITDFRLHVFITVARTLSFTRAAAILDVSQPAISKHIKQLELDFGEALFNRKGNTISLTPKGQDIVPFVESILDKYNQLNDTIKVEDNQFSGLVQIGASTTIAQYVLPSILAKFNKQYPHIKLSIISSNSYEIIKLLQEKQVDIALIEGDRVESSVHYTVLAEDEIVLVSRNKIKKPLSVNELMQIPLIIREEGSGTLSVLFNALKSRGITRRMLNSKMQLGSSEAILRYVQSSNDYAFVSVLVAKELIERGVLFTHDVEGFQIKRQFRFASLHGQNPRLITIFKDFCCRYYNF